MHVRQLYPQVSNCPCPLRTSLLHENCFSEFGCEKKMRREKEVRESKRREKDMKNREDLRYCLV